MSTSCRACVALVVVLIAPLALAPSGFAETPRATLAPPAQPAPPPAPVSPASERRYQLLRFDEDWSFLDTKPPSTPDAFDAVKNVHLSDTWRFLLGGSIRERLEADDGKSLGGPHATDEQLRTRLLVNWELRHGKDFRWFTEVRFSDTSLTDRPVSPLMEDDPDVQNLFFEGTFGAEGKHPVSVRAGRQELLFGSQKLVSPLDWSNTRRTWDGISVIARTVKTKTTFFATRPVVHEKHDFDSASDDVSFSGVTVVVRPMASQVVEGFAWLLHDSTGKYVSPVTGRHDDIDRQTWGARWEWSHANWSGDVEAALQRGDAAGDDIRAFMATTSAGYQWKKASWKPRASFGLDHASGDDDPLDGDVGTFEAPFPLGHAYFGHVDLVGRKNIEAARAELELWPCKGVKIDASLHAFRLADAHDALYEAGNAVLRKDPTGAAGRDVGTELDVLATWNFRTHHVVGVEVSRFWTGDSFERTGAGPDVWWGWVGYEFKF